MKKNTLCKLLTRMAQAAILLLTPTLMRADSISLVASSPTVTVGGTFQLDVIATNLQLGGYDVMFSYNPLLGLIDSNLIAFDSFLGGPSDSFALAFAGLDNIELAEVSFLTNAADLAALQTGASYPLAHIQVKALAAGTLTFGFVSTPFTVASGYSGEPIDGVTYHGTSVVIQAPNEPTPPPTESVPEPGTALFLMLGVGFIVAARLLRKPAPSM